MNDFIKRLSSRKFLLTVGGIVAVTLFPEIPSEALYLVLTFIGVEGVADVVARYKATDVQVKDLEKQISLIEQGEIPAGTLANGHLNPVPGNYGQE